MKLVVDVVKPCFTRVYGSDSEIAECRKLLFYRNSSMDFQYKKFKKSGYWFADRHGMDAFEARLAELKEAANCNLLKQDSDGFFVPTGSAYELARYFNVKIVNDVKYPEPKLIPWLKKPFQLREYQQTAVEKLLEARHGGIEYCTGAGKSLVVLELCKQLGLKTVVMAPSSSITEQLYKLFCEALGKKYVGLFAGAKKQTNKLITIATGQSLTRIEPGDKAWEDLSCLNVLVADESHSCPSETLEKVCFGLAAKAKYRFFVSATQTRNDGAETLLDGITGPIVSKLTVDQAVKLGVLAKPKFVVFKSNVRTSNIPQDPNECTRKFLYYNQDIIKKVAETANNAVASGMPTLILTKEIDQFAKLLPYLKYECGFAHGTLTEENKKDVPEKYWDSDPNELVDQFNEGKIQLLVGTTCVSTGTDFKPVKCLIYWQGGKSEIQVKQSIGRGTRVVPGKTEFAVFDFDVENIPTLHRHYQVREQMYKTLSDSIVKVQM